LEKDYFNVLVFGQKTSKTRNFRIHKKTFKIGLYLLGFGLLSTIFFLCDYIQIRKKTFELSQLRQQTKEQKSKIHFFSSKIEDLEEQLSRLKDFDKKIRIIANLERSQQTTPLLGIGGPSPYDVREKLKAEKDEKGLAHQLRTDIERLESEATSQEESLSELVKLLQSKKEMLVHTPSIWPVHGWVTSGFGFRTNPFTGLNQMHEGLDISYGIVVVISHGFGMATRYCHLNKISVRAGQKVKRGDKIAEVGTTGRSTGPHLHYEVRVNGIPVNPVRYILN
jgi:predicted RNase H-like nuclease (RuvC/YqgF family)